MTPNFIRFWLISRFLKKWIFTIFFCQFSGSSAFCKSSLNIWKFTVQVLLKPGLENFEHYFVSEWDDCNCAIALPLPFFGIEMKTDLFQSCGHCWVFQICGHIECSTFTASSFRIWVGIQTGIPSLPLALFIVMLPKAHLTSHSRMSGSRWVITPSWLSGSWKSFLYGSSVYCCQFFLISSASLRSIPFLSFIVSFILSFIYLYMKCSLGISNFHEEISNLPFYCFPLFLCIDHWGRLSYLSLLFFGTLHSNGYVFLFSFVFHLSFHSYL